MHFFSTLNLYCRLVRHLEWKWTSLVCRQCCNERSFVLDLWHSGTEYKRSESVMWYLWADQCDESSAHQSEIWTDCRIWHSCIYLWLLLFRWRRDEVAFNWFKSGTIDKYFSNTLFINKIKTRSLYGRWMFIFYSLKNQTQGRIDFFL